METYRCVCLSLKHITKEDSLRISQLSQSTLPEHGMIMERDTGFFIKLYEITGSNYYRELSERVNRLLMWARSMGFRMVELDIDAPDLEEFKTFDW